MIDTNIQDYAERFSSAESEILRTLRRKTFGERDDKNMLSGFYQGRILAMLSKMLRPRRILEIGTYMGYSALCLAEGLAPDGKLITLDLNQETHDIAKSFWRETEFDDKIEGLLGLATEIIPRLQETFDLVFIDADKENYSNYFDLIVPKMRVGGLIVADNVLWSGEVLQAEKGLDVSESAMALHEYSKKVSADKRVSNLLLAVRDGLLISRIESV